MPRLDLVIAASFGVYAVVEVFVLEEVGGPPVVSGVCLVAAAAALMWRRTAPLESAAVVAAAIGLQSLTGEAPEGLVVAGPVLISAYSVAAGGRRGLLGLGFLMAALALHTAGDPDVKTAKDVDDASFWWLAVVAAWLLGVAMHRHRRAHDLQAVTERLEHERDEAAARERARMARELHDVVSHGVSVIALQAGAAQETLGSDPENARERLVAIERTARTSGAELRRMLGVLHQDSDPADRHPQPTLRDLDGLLENLRSAGLPVTLRVEGAVHELPAGLQLSAYRVVQEGLTNAVKHAKPTHVAVAVRKSGGGLDVEVTHDGASANNAASGGYGLAGLRERVDLHGGSLEAGPVSGGEFRLRARLPA